MLPAGAKVPKNPAERKMARQEIRSPGPAEANRIPKIDRGARPVSREGKSNDSRDTGRVDDVDEEGEADSEGGADSDEEAVSDEEAAREEEERIRAYERAQSEEEERIRAYKRARINYRPLFPQGTKMFPLGSIKPSKLARSRSERTNKHILKHYGGAWDQMEELDMKEAKLSQEGAWAFKPGPDIDTVFLPVSTDMEAGSSIADYVTQGHGGPEASASDHYFDNWLDARGDEEELEVPITVESKGYLIDHILTQMMYVSGETGEPSAETTGMIEEIVRQQVVEILRNCTELAARRGSRSITINDLIFQIRDDAPKVSRLRTFLSWKDVRKNVKDSDDKGGDADLGAAEDPVGGALPGGPVDETTKKNKKNKVGLPWEPSSFFNQEVPEREDEEDEEEEEMNHITLQRLRKADERTKVMTREEYVTWSEYRQASFTYRKGKRFREWAGFNIVTDSKPSDDIVDILGFLTFEMVQLLTEEALKIKEHEDLLKSTAPDTTGTKKRKLAQGSLFDPPSEGRSPLEPRHVQEAFRRLQTRPKKSRAMLTGTRIAQKANLKLV